MRGRPGSFSTTAALVSFARTEGIVGLYRGILGALAGVVPYSLRGFPASVLPVCPFFGEK